MQITTRLALDRLGSARARRESYVGPWLPEPLLTGGAPVGLRPRRPPSRTDAAELGEQVSLALLVVLETLSPAERAVFVLREVFGMSVGRGRGRPRPHARPPSGRWRTGPGSTCRPGSRGSTPTGRRSGR